jgi:hypothetical protein
MAVHWPSTRAALLLLVLTLTRCTAVSAGVCNQLPVLPSDIVCRVSVRGDACYVHSRCSLPHTHCHFTVHFRPTNSNNAAGRPPFCRACISFCLIRLPRSPRKLRACACVCLWKPMQPQYTDGVCAMRACNAMLSVCSIVPCTHTNSPPKPTVGVCAMHNLRTERAASRSQSTPTRKALSSARKHDRLHS